MVAQRRKRRSPRQDEKGNKAENRPIASLSPPAVVAGAINSGPRPTMYKAAKKAATRAVFHCPSQVASVSCSLDSNALLTSGRLRVMKIHRNMTNRTTRYSSIRSPTNSSRTRSGTIKRTENSSSRIPQPSLLPFLIVAFSLFIHRISRLRIGLGNWLRASFGGKCAGYS